MNEPIMRRGLSVEGCKIRQKHQSSLLNEDFGVTSQPVHRKIEKKILKENVMRLKEIQAKCRTQQSRPLPSTHPVKAVRPPKIADLLSSEDIKPETREAPITKQREGSASHSDYFSLSDEAQTEIGRSFTADCSKESCSTENPQLEPHGNGVQGYRSPLAASKKQSDLTLHQNSKPESLNEETRLPATPVGPPAPFLNPFPLHQTKVGHVIERIKKQKPACDTNCDALWRDIEKQHKALLYSQACSRLSTPSLDGIRKPSHLRKSNFTPMITGAVAAPRSQSLDRVTRVKARDKFESVPLATVPLAVHRSSFDRNLQLEHFHPQEDRVSPQSGTLSSEEEPVKDTVGHSASFPNFTDENNRRQVSPLERAPCNLSSLHSSPLPSPSPTNEKMVSAAETEPFHFKDRPQSEIGCDFKLRNDEDSLHSGATESPSIPFGVSSVSDKKDALIQTSVSPSSTTRLTRSRSLGNLRPLGGVGAPPPSYQKGRLPRYLRLRKAEAQHRLEAAAAVDPLCPPGHSPLPDYERRHTLHLLKEGQTNMTQQLSSLPLAQDTLRVKKMKQELEVKLTQIEEGIAIFSQPKVYIATED